MNFTKHDFFREFRMDIYTAFKVRMIKESATTARLSPKWVIEEIRKEFRIKKLTGDEFKIDNSLTSYYIRVLLYQNPELKKLIVVKKSGADEMSEREMSLLLMGKNPDSEPNEIKTLTLF